MVPRGEKIMGFGHAVYRTDDPRSVMLRDVAAAAVDAAAARVAFADQVEARGARASSTS